MTKLTVSFVRQVMNEFHNEEITFSRMVEKLNEEVNRPHYKNDSYDVPVEETINTGDILIAINACEMDNGEGNALIIGKEYKVIDAMHGGFAIKSELNGLHWFELYGLNNYTDYLKLKS